MGRFGEGVVSSYNLCNVGVVNMSDERESTSDDAHASGEGKPDVHAVAKKPWETPQLVVCGAPDITGSGLKIFPPEIGLAYKTS